MTDNRPLSQQWYEAATEWKNKDAASRLLDDTASAIFNQRCAALGDIPVNRAEQTVKASKQHHDDIVTRVNAKTATNEAWIEMKYKEMQYGEWNSDQANERTMAKL